MKNPAVDRLFAHIFFLSLALHVLALAGWRFNRPLTLPLPLLQASLRSAATLRETPAVAPAAAATKVRQETAARVPVMRAPLAQPAGPTAPTVAAVAPAVAAVGESPAEAAPRHEPLVAPTSSAQSASIAAEDALAAYRRELTARLAGAHDYPRLAAMRGWEGEVLLRLRIARRGNLLGVVLDRSSGFTVLDQHALALLGSYGDLPPLPDAVAGSEIQVVVPIHYKLKKTT